MFCKYKNIFGFSNTGFHSHFIFGFAIFDLIGTYLLSLFVKKYIKKSTFIIFISLIILSILIHKLFCVDTKLLKILNLTN